MWFVIWGGCFEGWVIDSPRTHIYRWLKENTLFLCQESLIDTQGKCYGHYSSRCETSKFGQILTKWTFCKSLDAPKFRPAIHPLYIPIYFNSIKSAEDFKILHNLISIIWFQILQRHTRLESIFNVKFSDRTFLG